MPEAHSDLLDDLLGTAPKPCRWVEILDTLDPEVRASIDQAVAQGVTAYRIAAVLNRRGIVRAHDDTIRSHMRGTCRCQRTT